MEVPSRGESPFLHVNDPLQYFSFKRGKPRCSSLSTCTPPISYNKRRDPRVTVIQFAFRLPGTGDAKHFNITTNTAAATTTTTTSTNNNNDYNNNNNDNWKEKWC